MSSISRTISPHVSESEDLRSGEGLIETDGMEGNIQREAEKMQEDENEGTSSAVKGPVSIQEPEPLGEDEAQAPRGARAPRRPGAKEVEDHNITHCPPRSWCDSLRTWPIGRSPSHSGGG